MGRCISSRPIQRQWGKMLLKCRLLALRVSLLRSAMHSVEVLGPPFSRDTYLLGYIWRRRVTS